MIRLLRMRKKRAGPESAQDEPSMTEMIEPAAPARGLPFSETGNAGGEAGIPLFEPSLKIVSVEDLDEADLTEIRDGFPHLDLDAAREGGETAKPAHPRAHDADRDRAGDAADATHDDG
ncbi:MAG: hypothetical protein ACREH3_11155, partial [Geminicoccales bacterium]